jgi:hypothetical protein
MRMLQTLPFEQHCHLALILRYRRSVYKRDDSALPNDEKMLVAKLQGEHSTCRGNLDSLLLLNAW